MNSQQLITSAACLLAFCLMPNSAWARGRDVDNGGRAKVCINDAGTMTSVELVDLWEARIGPEELTNISSNESVEEILARVVPRLVAVDPKYFANLADEVAYVVSTRRILPDEVALDLIDDHDSKILPRGCRLEQLADYQRFQSLEIVGLLFKKLDNVNQAALYLHEATYKITNDLENADTSVKARRLVGWAFSTLDDSALMSLYRINYGTWEPGQPRRCDIQNTKGLVIGYVRLDDGEIMQLTEGRWQSLGNIDTDGRLIVKGPSYMSYGPTPLELLHGDTTGRFFDQNSVPRGRVLDNHKVVKPNGDQVGVIAGCDLTSEQNLAFSSAAAARLLLVQPKFITVQTQVESPNPEPCMAALDQVASQQCGDGLRARRNGMLGYAPSGFFSMGPATCSGLFLCGYSAPAQQ